MGETEVDAYVKGFIDAYLEHVPDKAVTEFIGPETHHRKVVERFLSRNDREREADAFLLQLLINSGTSYRANKDEKRTRWAWGTTLSGAGVGFIVGDVLNLAWFAGLVLICAGVLIAAWWKVPQKARDLITSLAFQE